MVDGTLIPLASKPGHFGEQFLDCKSNYSLGLTVSTHFMLLITGANILLAHNTAKPSDY